MTLVKLPSQEAYTNKVGYGKTSLMEFYNYEVFTLIQQLVHYSIEQSHVYIIATITYSIQHNGTLVWLLFVDDIINYRIFCVLTQLQKICPLYKETHNYSKSHAITIL